MDRAFERAAWLALVFYLLRYGPPQWIKVVGPGAAIAGGKVREVITPAA